MALHNNPFYLLRVSCSAGRREIVSACDEMSFALDPDICSEAQNKLINISKRLSAEINWFLDVDANTIDQIRMNIDNSELISTDGFTALSRLNASLYNFSLLEFDDYLEIGYSILEIDEQYADLDVDRIVELINENREKAKLGVVQTQDVIIELGKKREEIRQIITDKLSSLDQDAYVELVTMIAEKCIADDLYTDGVILFDVVDQYEIRIQSVLDERTEGIKKHIETIEYMKDESDISEQVDLLINNVKEWDILAQPLQLKSQASGIPHETSEQLGLELRNLALLLHNEKGMTKDAFSLVNAMKSVFAELGELVDLFDSDSSALNNLLKGQQEAERIIDEINSIKSDSESIIFSPSSIKVNHYVERVKRLDRRIIAIGLDSETEIKLRASLCYIARNTAVELHNSKNQTLDAITITQALQEEFGDIPELKNKLQSDFFTLGDQFAKQEMSRLYPTRSSRSSYSPSSSSSSSKRGFIIGALVIIGIIILISIVSSHGNSSSKSSSSSSSSKSSSYSQNYNGSSSSKSGSSKSSSSLNNTINLSKSNFETHFFVDTDAEFVGDKVTIKYSITPKYASNYKFPESSDTIEVELGAAITLTQYSYGEPDYNKKHSITLKKSEDYTTSGSFSFTYYSYSDTVYWLVDVTSCSGEIRQS